MAHVQGVVRGAPDAADRDDQEPTSRVPDDESRAGRSVEWREDYRRGACDTVAVLLRGRMEHKAVRTTHAIERRFRDGRGRTADRTFQDRTSMDRILFAVFIHENRN